MSLLTSISRYVLDDRLPAHAGLPESSSPAADPYLAELHELFPADIYPGGVYFDLPEGQVRAWQFGPKAENKGKVLLVHGLSMPSIIWQPVANALVEVGYEVALFDLYGRGYSSAPRGTYKNALYVNQVLGVLDKLGWREPVYLAGLSMGGPICAEFTATFPERVRKVAMLAPAAFFGVWPPLTSRFGKAMLLAPWYNTHISWPFRKAYSRYCTELSITRPPPQSSARLERVVTLQYCLLPGYAPAIAKSLLHGPLFDYTLPYEKLARTDMDVLVIWGTADAVVSYEFSAGLMRTLGSRAALHTVQGGVHDLPTSDHGEVTPALLRFFR